MFGQSRRAPSSREDGSRLGACPPGRNLQFPCRLATGLSSAKADSGKLPDIDSIGPSTLLSSLRFSFTRQYILVLFWVNIYLCWLDVRLKVRYQLTGVDCLPSFSRCTFCWCNGNSLTIYPGY